MAKSNSQRFYKLMKAADQDPFLSALVLSKLQELAEAAINYPEELRKDMEANGSANMIRPDLVINTYQKIYEIVS